MTIEPASRRTERPKFRDTPTDELSIDAEETASLRQLFISSS